MSIPFVEQPVPVVDTAQMIEVDRLMIEVYGIELMQMMENAGRNLAHLARERFLAGDPRGKRVVVLAGTGGNGGGAMVCARRLHNYGALVQLFLAKPDEAYAPVPHHQLKICRRMGLKVEVADEIETAVSHAPQLIIDGVIGYSLRGNPRGGAKTLIDWAGKQPAPVLALDAPSGVDTSSGKLFTPAIRATATMTLALPKAGLLGDEVADQVGELYLADISVPPELFASASLQLAVGHLFAQNEIVRLR